MPDGHKWRPIADLPEDLSEFRDRELEALFHVWSKQREVLSQQESLARFNTELAREWAVETGIIEGIYKLDRGVTQTLIERGIEARHIPDDSTDRNPELVARIIQSHNEVLEGLFAFVKSERPLSTSYIKELHAALLRHQTEIVVFDQFGNPFSTELKKGMYKTLPNNPQREDGSMHEYCPAEHVASEMDSLVALHRDHLSMNVPAEIEAAWLHHAFTQIHPFQDGNGRVARALASLTLIRSGYFPLVITRDDREKYIDALEAADSGDLGTLIRLFDVLQKRLLTKAIGLAIDVQPANNVSEAITAARDLLVNLGRIFPKDWLKAKDTAIQLVNSVHQKFEQMQGLLTREIGNVDNRFRFSMGVLGTPPSAINQIAGDLHYEPDVSQFHHSTEFKLTAPSDKTAIVVSFHGLGAAYRGLLAASVYCQVGDNRPIALSDDIFRISYDEVARDVTQRFEKWLEPCLVKGIGIWRRTLV